MLVAFDTLRQLRRLTFGGYPVWPLRSLPDRRREHSFSRLRLPASMEVRTAGPAQPLPLGGRVLAGCGGLVR